MKLLKEERGISLVEVVASLVLITIILISFFSFFVQSKKTHVASESIVDATYIAQQEMEEVYGFILDRNVSWFNNPTPITLQNLNKEFTYKDNIDCGTDCKRFVFTYEDDNGNPIYDEDDWIQLSSNTQYPNLVNVIVNVPKENTNAPVVMESIFRWRDY